MPRDLESFPNWVIQSRECSPTHLFSPYLLSAYCVPGILLDARNTAVTKETKALNFMKLVFGVVGVS